MLGVFLAATDRLGRCSRPLRRVLRNLRVSQDGQAIVELALAVPILLVVVFGIVDFGKAVNYWNDETHVANLAARYTAVAGLPTAAQDSTCGGKSTPKEYVECEVGIDSTELKSGCGASCNGAQGAINVCVSIPKEEVGAPVEVKLSSKYKWLPLPKVLGGVSQLATSTLSGTATMRLERTPPSNFKTTTAPCP